MRNLKLEQVIGIAGAGPTVGKSTVRKLIVERWPELVVVNFADELKNDVIRMVRGFTGIEIDREELERQKGDIFGPVCQGLGQFMRHYVRPDYWADQWTDVIRLQGMTHVIADDVRHLNEAAVIRSLGGYLLYVEGPQHRADGRSLAHISERNNGALKQSADIVVVNSGSLDDLAREVDQVLESILLMQRSMPNPGRRGERGNLGTIVRPSDMLEELLDWKRNGMPPEVARKVYGGRIDLSPLADEPNEASA